jgi:hypothetical protein
MAPPTAKRRRISVSSSTLERARKSANGLTVEGAIRGKPLSRFIVEVFGNRAAGSGEGEMFLGEAFFAVSAFAAAMCDAKQCWPHKDLPCHSSAALS